MNRETLAVCRRELNEYFINRGVGELIMMGHEGIIVVDIFDITETRNNKFKFLRNTPTEIILRWLNEHIDPFLKKHNIERKVDMVRILITKPYNDVVYFDLDGKCHGEWSKVPHFC